MGPQERADCLPQGERLINWPHLNGWGLSFLPSTKMAIRNFLSQGQTGAKSINDALSPVIVSAGSSAPVNAVAATRVLTMSVQPTAGDTITVANKVFTFVASGADADGEINVGADLAAAKVNLVAAINGSDGINTAHTLVTAAAFSTHAMTITAIVKGTAANSYATTETFTSGSNVWAGATMTGGIDGTVGVAWEQFHYSGFLYINASDTPYGTATDTWRKVATTLVS